MDEKLTQRVTVLAVGIENYKYMRPLKGPREDIQNLRHLLVTAPETALYKPYQFIELFDPTSEVLRQRLNDYILGRSANNDILIFYFSGHGVPVGRNDFGFCTVDTISHPGANAVLPLTLLKFSDLLNSISVMDISPVIIIDACFSGTAGGAITSHEAMTTMHDRINQETATNHALFCSCSDLQSSLSSSIGGIFSNCLFEVVNEGISSAKGRWHLIGLKQIYQHLMRKVEAKATESSPRVYVGETLPDFPLAKNTQYRPQNYSFVGHLKSIIDALWNDGTERELSASEIDEICGKGAYGNHRKLSYEPWQLVENDPTNRKRRLTERGRMFVQGKLTIPRDIQKDPVTQQWVPAKNSMQINFQDD